MFCDVKRPNGDADYAKIEIRESILSARKGTSRKDLSRLINADKRDFNPARRRPLAGTLVDLQFRTIVWTPREGLGKTKRSRQPVKLD